MRISLSPQCVGCQRSTGGSRSPSASRAMSAIVSVSKSGGGAIGMIPAALGFKRGFGKLPSFYSPPLNRGGGGGWVGVGDTVARASYPPTPSPSLHQGG